MKVFYWKDIERMYYNAQKNDKTGFWKAKSAPCFSNNKKTTEEALRLFKEKPSALSIGAFDGPHRGHESLFDAVLSKKNEGYNAGLVSFIQSPKTHKKKLFHGEISTLDLRLSFFEEKKFDFVILIDFSPKFSRMVGEVFLSVLFSVSKTRFLAVGPDFRCGYQGKTDVEQIASITKKQSVQFQVLDEFLVGGQRVRSTHIREAVIKGDFNQVRLLLGRSYMFDISQLRKKQEKTSCVKTNTWRVFVEKSVQVLPPEGTYTVLVHFADNSSVSALCIHGTRFLRLEFHEVKDDTPMALDFGY